MALTEIQTLHFHSSSPDRGNAPMIGFSSEFLRVSHHDGFDGRMPAALRGIELPSEFDNTHMDDVETLGALDSTSAYGPDQREGNLRETAAAVPDQNNSHSTQADIKDNESQEPGSPFRKWMKTLHRRAKHRPPSPTMSSAMDATSTTHTSTKLAHWRGHHRQSSSGSSFGFVTTMRSASVSLASASVVTRQRTNTKNSQGHARTERSSRASFTAIRLSEDSALGDRLLPQDAAALERSVQRRRIVEELIYTEESYIGDVRFLLNVYVTILASLPTLPLGLRSSINQNLTEVIKLHEEILRDLHRVVPNSEYTQRDATSITSAMVCRGHRRWRSLDAVPEDKRTALSFIQDRPELASEAQIAGDVAKVFSRKMDRFFIYEEYGAKYEMMVKDIATAHRRMPEWDTYQKGLEALACSLGPVNSSGGHARKSLTIGDLLVKPIQRVCRYPLLFAELLKFTPVKDDPNSHMEVESALLRLREATSEINRATNDHHIKSTLAKTWILQDRLVFPNHTLDAASRNRIRAFGHVELCGTLHICWQHEGGVRGQYMVCLLYHNTLCLASAGKVEQIYTIEACINLSNIKIEKADNGRGLQCHTAPFSWKLVFESSSQLYEVIMTACSDREQNEWRSRLYLKSTECQEQMNPNLYSAISMDIRSLGAVFGKPGTVARRISIHRATTVGPKSPLCQVILKNTSGVRETPGSLGLNINRSQSLLTTNNRVPILTPHRAERARLEALLSDVWSRESLPFPSMTNMSRSEQIVRSSASTMMRKLSVTSITSSFSRRSNSVASMSKIFDDNEAEDGPTFLPTAVRPALNGRTVSEHSTAPTIQASARTTLPRIQDENERKSSAASNISISVPERAGGVVLGHPQPHKVCHESIAGSDDTVRLKEKISQPSSMSSICYEESSRSITPTEKSSCASDANFVSMDRASKRPKLAHRGSSRWGKVGALNRDSMVRGIRSFFR